VLQDVFGNETVICTRTLEW